MALTTESDWFDIQHRVTNAAGGYKNFPTTGTDGFTGVEAYNISGNFTYLRVKMDRSHLGDGTTYQSDYGSIAYIRMSA